MDPKARRLSILNQDSLSIDPLYQPQTLMQLYKSTLTTLACQKHHTLPWSHVEVTERVYIESVLLMLQGTQSRFFVQKESGFERRQVYCFSHLTAKALSKLSQQFIQLANKIAFIRNRNKLFKEAKNLVVQQFAFCLQSILQGMQKKFIDLQLQLYRQQGLEGVPFRHAKGKSLTLLQLNQSISQQKQIVETLLKLINKKARQVQIERQNGVTLLNSLWQLFNQNQHASVESAVAKVSLKLFNHALVRYLQFLIQWLRSRRITDPFKQFIFNDNLQVQASGQFKLIPEFMSPLLSRLIDILLAIKYIELLLPDQLFFQFQASLKIEQNTSILLSHFKIQNKIQKPRRARADLTRPVQTAQQRHNEQLPQNNPYDIYTPCEINPFYVQSSARKESLEQTKATITSEEQHGLLCDFQLKALQIIQWYVADLQNIQDSMFKEKEGLQGYILSQLRIVFVEVKNFMLMGAGAFYSIFLEKAFDDLERPVSDTSQRILNNHLKRALLQSDLQDSIIQIKIQGCQQIVWNKLELCLGQNKFVSLLFSREMEIYKKILRKLLRLRRHQIIMTQVWYRHAKFINKHVRAQLIFVQQYRLQLTKMINLLLQFCMDSVQAQWSIFINSLPSAHSFRTVLKNHEKFIRCVSDCLFLLPQRKNVFDCVNNLLLRIDQFNSLNEAIMHQIYDNQFKYRDDRIVFANSKRTLLERGRKGFEVQLDNLLRHLSKVQIYKQLKQQLQQAWH